MPASLIVPLFFAEGTFGAAALTLAVHLVTTMVIASLMDHGQSDQPSSTGNTGGKTQLPPYTDNAIPVIYGDAWTAPVIVDAKISNDQQVMWYVLAFSEQTDSGTINFGEVYWDDKLLIFDPANPSEILGWYDAGQNETVYGVAGKISMWFYAGDSESPTSHYCRNIDGTGGGYQTSPDYAYDILSNADISAGQWTTQYMMNGCVFAVVKVVYDQSTGITGLSNNIKAKIQNTLKQPGSVMVDYLVNDRYGCGVPAGNVDSQAFTDLNTYSAITNTRVPVGDHPFSEPHYTINGIIAVTNNCLNNLAMIADNCDSWVQWNEAEGKWGVLMNRSVEEINGIGYNTDLLPTITSDNIIGGIQITPLDLNSSYNQIQVQFPNSIFWDATQSTQVLDTYRGQPDYRFFEIPTDIRSPNEPNNQLSINLPFTNNSVQATFIAYKRLFASREDLIITFTMDYSGIQYDAGDIICVQHEWYGWIKQTYGGQYFPGKPFRITQIRELKATDGTLSAQISATSYNPLVYDTTDPHYFTPSGFVGISNPDIISKPGAPIYRDDLGTTGTTFVVQSTIPTTGNTIGMEFWYSQKGAELTANNYSLYGTQYYATTSTNVTQTAIYPHTQTDGVTLYFEQMKAVGLPTASYWWRTRAIGANTTSEFSDASAQKDWVLTGGTGGTIDGTQIADNSIGGSKLVSGQSATPAQPSKSNSIFDQLGPVLLASLAAATAYGAYKYLGADYFGSDDDVQGGGNDNQPTETFVNPYTTPRDPDTGQPILQAKEGDMVEYVADATPPQPDPVQVADNDGFQDYGIPGYADIQEA